MTDNLFAFDKSNRRIDANGMMHVENCNISKATVNKYYGREIPNYKALGLNPDGIYKLLRDPKELEKAAPTFANLPILSEHEPISSEKPRKDLTIGSIGTDVEFNSPYLVATVSFWDAEYIAAIETDTVRELSCAYRYVAVMNSGEYEGQKYDGVMTEIQGNHLALVEVGRAGSDVIVADRNPFIKQGITDMKMTKLGKALSVSISAAFPILAQDSLPPLVKDAEIKTLNKDALIKAVLALDGNIDAGTLGDIIEAIAGAGESPEAVEPEQPKVAEDDDVAAQVAALCGDKLDAETVQKLVALIAPAATDEFPEKDDKGGKEEEMKHAMDSLRKELRDAEKARRDVRGIVGDVEIEQAADVYKFALDHMTVDHEGVDDVVALRALFKVASTKPTQSASIKIAQDSAKGMTERFPAANRIKQI